LSKKISLKEEKEEGYVLLHMNQTGLSPKILFFPKVLQSADFVFD